jgi:hypothetical protein
MVWAMAELLPGKDKAVGVGIVSPGAARAATSRLP